MHIKSNLMQTKMLKLWRILFDTGQLMQSSSTGPIEDNLLALMIGYQVLIWLSSHPSDYLEKKQWRFFFHNVGILAVFGPTKLKIKANFERVKIKCHNNQMGLILFYNFPPNPHQKMQFYLLVCEGSLQ